MKILIIILLFTAAKINAQADTTDWKVLDVIEIALKYIDEPIATDLLYRTPQRILEEQIDYLNQKEKDILYLKEVRREYIERMRQQAKKSK